MTDRLLKLTDAGVSIWLDDLSRDRLSSGSLRTLVQERQVSGVTTNPSIFAKAIQSSNVYNAQVRELAARGADTGEALRELTAHDVRAACDVLRSTYDATDGIDGRVSIEVEARLAHDAVGMIAEARALWWMVDRPNLFIKIPATLEGLPAIAACLEDGISINVTLIFSLERYDQVIDAFLSGMERARDAGRDLRGLESVASFFVSRVDTETDARLDRIGGERAARLRGRAAIANARLAYRTYERMLASPRWRALAAAGARPQRPLWASTSVKDRSYPDTRYVTELVARGVVNTMPEATMLAVADHGVIPADSIYGTYEEAEAVLRELAEVGVDYDDVVTGLERDAIAAFTAAWVGVAADLASALSESAHH
ncbi:transaldolase [Planctomonas sp. JC2975]|uniref:transaldolase n=1 Tax=Planctomonas sp. JC2975 TaxID=2729626 RepID=UPI0014740250|nr:transaldolase [Planctomonas sp. JC2975]NNC11624.1 transaldolase [Planctomonas sp. JC2975]